MREIRGDVREIHSRCPGAICCVPVNGNAVLPVWTAFPQIGRVWAEFLRENSPRVHLFAYCLVAFPMEDVRHSLEELEELAEVFGWARVFLSCSEEERARGLVGLCVRWK